MQESSPSIDFSHRPESVSYLTDSDHKLLDPSRRQFLGWLGKTTLVVTPVLTLGCAERRRKRERDEALKRLGAGHLADDIDRVKEGDSKKSSDGAEDFANVLSGAVWTGNLGALLVRFFPGDSLPERLVSGGIAGVSTFVGGISLLAGLPPTPSLVGSTVSGIGLTGWAIFTRDE